MRRGLLIGVAVALLIGAGSGLTQTPATFDLPDQAFLAGMQGCLSRFDPKTPKQFDDPAAFPGFAPSPESRDAMGVRSLVVSAPDALILKADLVAGAESAVYVVIPRGLPLTCRLAAVHAPGAHLTALAWLESPDGGWTLKVAEQADAHGRTRSRVYGRPFEGDIGVGATLMWQTGPHGSLTAVSSMSLARER